MRFNFDFDPVCEAVPGAACSENEDGLLDCWCPVESSDPLVALSFSEEENGTASDAVLDSSGNITMPPWGLGLHQMRQLGLPKAGIRVVTNLMTIIW